MNVNAGTIGIELTASTAQFRQDMASAQNVVTGAMAQIQRSTMAASTSFTGVTQALGGASNAAKDFINSSLGIIDADTKVSYANKKLADSLNDQIRSMTMSRSEMTLYKTTLAGTSTEVQELGRRLAQLQGAQDAYTESTKKGAHAMGQFSLGSAGSTRELLVLGHEMSQGNYSRFGGSLLVLAERSNAMSLIFSAAGVATLALVGALGLLAFAVIKGHMESAELNKQMQLTSNYAGMTAGQFDNLALKIGESTHMGVGFARDVTASLAASGNMNAKTLAIASEAASNFARLSGKSAEDVGSDFSKMSGGVTQWAETHTQAYHFLTGDQYLYIATLEKEGHTQEAMQATMEAFNDHAKKNVASLTELQSAWAATRYSLSEFWDMLKGIGRDATIEDKVRAAAQALKDAKATLSGSGGAGQDSDNARKLKVTIAQAEANLKVLQTQRDLQESDKQDLATQAKFRDASVNAQKAVAALRLSLMDRQQQGEEAVKQYELGQKAIIAAGDKAYDNEATHIKMVADIREQYAKPDTIDKADTYRLEAMLRHAQRETAATVQHLDDLAKLDDLYHKAGELSDAQFYENKRVFADARASAEVQGFDKQLKALVDHDNSTEAEEERTQKAINDIWDKRIDAIKKAAAAKELADQEERLRQKKIISDSDDAMNKYVSGLHKELETLTLANEGHEKSKTAVEAEAVAVLDNAIAYQQAFIAQQASNGATEEEIKQAPKILEFLKTQRDVRAQISTGLATKDVDTANRKAAEAASEAWKRSAKTIEDDLTSAILDGGGKGWKKLVKDMEFAFARMVLQPLLAPIAGGIASFLNPGAPQANGGVIAGTSALINQASAANSLYNLYNGGLVSSLGGGIASLGGFTGSTALSAFGSGVSGVAGGTFAGMGATVAGSETGLGALVGSGAAEAGGALSGSLTAAMAAIPGWGWAALGAAAIGAYLLSGGGPISDSRLTFGSNNAAGAISINERGNEGQTSNPYINSYSTSALGTFGVTSSFWMNAGQPVVQDFIKTVSKTDDALAALMTTSERASVTAYLTGKSSVANTGSEDANPNATGQLDKVFADRINNILEGIQPGMSKLLAGFTGTSKELETEAEALLQYRTALKSSGEAMFGSKVVIEDLIALRLPTEKTSQTLTRLYAEFDATNSAAAAIGKTAKEAFGDVFTASVKSREQLIAFAGSSKILSDEITGNQSMAGYMSNFLTAEERLAPVTKAVAAAMDELGLSSVTTRDQFKSVVSGLDLTSEAGAKEFTSLMALEEAFAQVHPVIEATASAARSAADILAERKQLQDQVDQATMTSTELLAKQRDALDQSNRALFDQLQAAKAAKEAADQAAKVSAEKETLSIQLMEAVGNAEGALAAKRHDALAALLSDTARATQVQIWAAQDAADAVAKAQSTAAAVRTSAEAAASSAQQVANTARAALTSSYQREQSSLQALINTKLAEAAATRKQIDAFKIGSLSAMTPEMQYAEAQRQFEQASGADKTSAGSALLTISQQFNGSTEAYRRDFELVQAGLADSARASEQQASDGQTQLALLEDQVRGLVTLNSSVLSVADAIDQLRASTQVLGQAQAAVAALPPASSAASSVVTPPAPEALPSSVTAPAPPLDTHLAGKSASLQAIDAGLENLYQSMFNRHSDPSGLAFWENAVANQGVSLSEVSSSFMSSGEYRAIKGFALGGDHSGGWRIVGEDGPELEATGPSRILNAKQSAALLGGDGEGSVKELKEVKELLRIIAGKRTDSPDLAAAVQVLAKKVDALTREQALMRQKGS